MAIHAGRSRLRVIVIMTGLLLTSHSVLQSRAGTLELTCEWLDSLHTQLEEIGLKADATNTSEAVVLGLIQEVDTKARILAPGDWETIRNERSGLFYSFGLSLEMTNGLPMINAIETNAPIASVKDVTTGDLIIGVGTQKFNKIALPDIQLLLKGSDTEPNVLHIIHGSETNTVFAERSLLQEPAIELVELFANNMGYIKINGLYKNSGRDVVSRIRAWSETKRDGIILDLRGAGGDDTKSAAEIASLFSHGGQFLFAFRDLHQQDLEVVKALESEPVSIPLMILIDQRTTGAAEVLAAVINGSARESLLIGEATGGDFSLREAVGVAGHSVLVAVKVLDTADGIRYNGKFGLQPAITVEGVHRDTHDYEPPEDLLDRREKLEEELTDLQTRRRVRGDGALERAIDILIGLKSLNKADSRLSSPDSL